MTCEQWRDVVLEAEPAELRGEGTSEFAQHIRSCPRCSALARQIVEDLDALSTALAMQSSAVPVGTAVTDAATEAARRRKRKKVWRTVVPALAAASLAGLLIAQRIPREIGVRPLPDERHVAGLIPDVEAPGDRDYMVIGSDNSKIVIIWFF